jgi:hypothetical protein
MAPSFGILHDFRQPLPHAAGYVALHARAPFDDFAAWARLPGLSHEQALGALRLVARRVVPEVRRALG